MGDYHAAATAGYPLHNKHDATSRTSEPTSQNRVPAKVAELSFHALG